MSAWRDIGTAPKGTRVIVWNGDDVCEARQLDDGVWWASDEFNDYENGMPMRPQPTHYQPLPAPPAHEGDP